MEPKWWKRLIPKYGNWGGPGWSAGEYCPPSYTNWAVPGIDDMDALFKQHDMAYQSGGDRKFADRELVRRLKETNVRGVWSNIYRIGAIVIFSAKGL